MIENVEGNVVDISGDGWKVLAGSCLDRLKELEDNSIDAVVTDPPYELGFMGKSWDSSGIAFNVEVWAECLRVLKPGGHLLAFGGSRTWHRIAVAIEDAGFEVRDSIAWLYGSGFPKSLDVSKAIDKVNGEGDRLIKFVRYMQGTGLKAKTIDDALKAAGLISPTSNRAVHYFNEGQPNIPTWEMWQVIRPLLSDVPHEIDVLVDRVEAEREVIGQKPSSLGGTVAAGERNADFIAEHKDKMVDVTAPATPEAQKWQGWGTALKPAFEPVVVARKPLTSTVAGNVLEWGVGGLNIDGTRIGTETRTFDSKGIPPGGDFVGQPWKPEIKPVTVQGRWPSNVMLDEFTAALVDEQSGFSKSSGVINRWTDGAKPFGNGAGGAYESVQGVADSGGASRFFYVAKASKRDRNEGLDELEERIGENGNKWTDQDYRRGDTEPVTGRKNFHPTVKPTDLMRQLIRLVTPLGGTVLDPFTGSGSTGKAAILEGMQFIGCELTEDYLPIIQGRIDWAVEQVKADKLKAEQEQAEVLF